MPVDGLAVTHVLGALTPELPEAVRHHDHHEAEDRARDVGDAVGQPIGAVRLRRVRRREPRQLDQQVAEDHTQHDAERDQLRDLVVQEPHGRWHLFVGWDADSPRSTPAPRILGV